MPDRVSRKLRVVSKVERRRQLMAVVRTTHIATQAGLVTALRGRGLDVTQATISRDLRELGVLRIHDTEGARYVVGAAEIDPQTAEQRLVYAFREYVESIEFIDYIGVVHTRAGSASLVASAIDGGRFDAVAGTIAGDDTVMIIARSRPAAQMLARHLESVGAE